MNLTIEQMREIVDSAPLGATDLNGGNYFKENDYGVWCIWKGYWVSNFKWPEGQMIGLDSLRTAIANHECDHDWENISTVESVERQLICTYCSERKTEPFELNAQRWSDEETDHCSDIRNHISPNTKVIEQ